MNNKCKTKSQKSTKQAKLKEPPAVKTTMRELPRGKSVVKFSYDGIAVTLRFADPEDDHEGVKSE